MEQLLKNSKFEILTDEGFKDFYGLQWENSKDIIKITTSNNTLICTTDHKIFLHDLSYKKAKDLNISDILYNNEIVVDKSYINTDNIEVFDILHVADVNRFFANDILVKNCIILDEFAHIHNNLAEEFFTSTYPVISSGKESKLIIISTPRGMNLFYKIWTEAVAEKNGYNYIDVPWRRIPGRDEKFKEDTIKATSLRQWNQEFQSSGYETQLQIDGRKIQIGKLYEELLCKQNQLKKN